MTAALEMRADLRSIGIEAHAVILQGDVWAGAVGDDVRARQHRAHSHTTGLP